MVPSPVSSEEKGIMNTANISSHLSPYLYSQLYLTHVKKMCSKRALSPD